MGLNPPNSGFSFLDTIKLQSRHLLSFPPVCSGICPAAGTGCWIWYTVYSNAGTDSGGLRFFIPVRLVEWEYFPTSKEKPDLEAEQFRKSQDFAFFAVQFGYSKADYNALTETERALILKAYENKVVADTNLLAGAVLNAVSNAFRKKGKKPQKKKHL